MVECPTCASTSYRKKGKTSGRQRYQCKDCGRNFLVPLPPRDEAIAPESSDTESSALESSAPDSLAPDSSAPESSVPESPGISILLLDVENIRLSTQTEKFLCSISPHSLQVKIAFADWKNPSISKLDTELHERGYQLIHVPGGRDSVDGKMIAIGSSIFLNYPTVKEVFVCSSDGIFTHLCTELESRGLSTYRVYRDQKNLYLENRSKHQFFSYSLQLQVEVVQPEKMLDKFQSILHLENKSLQERLSNIEKFLYVLIENQSQSQPDRLPQEIVEQYLSSEIIDKNSLDSKDNLQKAIQQTILYLSRESNKSSVSLSELGIAFMQHYKTSCSEVLRKLKLGKKLIDFLQQSELFEVQKNGKIYHVNLAKK